LAAGLAHELNQPLGAIVNYADTCARRLRAEDIGIDAAVDLVRRISEQAKRAGLVIRRLREFVRRRTARLAAVSINDLVREVVGLVEVEARRREATVRLELGGHLPPAYADGIQVEQVLLNLVQNGLEAMADTPRCDRELSIRTAPHGHDMIEVAVSDAGCGLTAEALEQVSEPFYTTKPHGIGLGLAISRTIVEAHGGRWWVTPNADRGSTLSFVLPCAGPETRGER
jgi:C4-dicarboxylate-specific signal transduction histidine kinase